MKKLYVGNLPFQASEEQLQEWFAEAGITTVETVSLIRDRYSGTPRGFGFVSITNDEEAEKAIQTLNGKQFLERTLVVNEARPQQGGDRRGGGYGGGGGKPGGGGRPHRRGR